MPPNLRRAVAWCGHLTCSSVWWTHRDRQALHMPLLHLASTLYTLVRVLNNATKKVLLEGSQNCAFESLTLAAERTNSANSLCCKFRFFYTHTLFLDEIFPPLVFFLVQLKNLHFLAIRLLRDAAFRVNCFIFFINLLLLQHWNFFNFFFSLHSLTYSILQASWFHVFQPNFAHELAYLCKLSLEAVKMSEYLISAPSRMRFWLVFMEFRRFSQVFFFSSLHSFSLPPILVRRPNGGISNNKSNKRNRKPTVSGENRRRFRQL